MHFLFAQKPWMTSARYQFAKYLQSFVTGCSSNLWEISKISSNDQLSSIEPNSSSNTKVPQICPSIMIVCNDRFGPDREGGHRLPGSKHLEPDCVRQQTRISWNSVLVISTAGIRLQALGYSFLSRWPMKVVGGLVCWLLCGCWAGWAMLILMHCALLDT